MKSKRLINGSWIIYLVLLLGLYFSEMVFINEGVPVRFMSLKEILPFFLGIFLIVIIFFYFEKKYNKDKNDWPLIIILSSLFLMFAIVLLAFPGSKELVLEYNGTTYTGVYNLNRSERIYYILMSFISCLSAYFYLSVMPKKYYFTRIINIAYYVALIFMAVVIIYSYITEFDIYVSFFSNFFTKGISGYATPKSFFPHRNNLGFIYLTMICFTLLVHHNRPRWWFYAIAGYLLFNSFPCISKTNLVLSVFIIVFYLIGRFFFTYKKHKKMNIIAGSIGVAVVISLILLVIISVTVKNPLGLLVIRIFDATFRIMNGHVPSLFSRFELWNYTIQLLNQTSWMFGVGHGLFNSVLKEYYNLNEHQEPTTMPHSGYLQILGTGGIVLMLVFIAAIAYIVYNLIKIGKEHRTLAYFEWGFLFLILVHMIFESPTPLVFSIQTADSLIFTLILVLPILNTRYRDTHKEVLEEIVADSKDLNPSNYIKNKYSMGNMLYFFLVPVVAFILGVVYTLFGSTTPLWYLAIMMVAILVFVFAPYFVNSLVCKKKEFDKPSLMDFIHNVFIFHAFALLLLVGYFVLASYLMKESKTSLLFVTFSGVLIYLTLYVYIEPAHAYGDVLFTFIDNTNIKTIKLYAPFIEKELKYREEKQRLKSIANTK